MHTAERTAATQAGFSLLELLLAMLLLGMISTMIYSVMNVGIRFADKGEKKIVTLERKQSILSLLHRQISSAWYSEVQKKIMISANDEVFKIVTRSPLIYRSAPIVLALYRYNHEDRTLYYTEKRDYYNIDYGEDYVPEYEEMVGLITTESPMTIDFDEETAGEGVLLEFEKKHYELIPRCQDLSEAKRQ